MIQDNGKALPAAPSQASKNSQIGGEDEMEEHEEEEEEESKALDEIAEFSSIMVWGHEQPPDDEDDMMTRGVAEWIGFAETVRYFVSYM